MTETHILNEKVAKRSHQARREPHDDGLELYKLDIIIRLRDRCAGYLATLATRSGMTGLLAREAA